MNKPVEKVMTGWGNYPQQVGYVYRPETMQEVKTIVQNQAKDSLIPYGLGRSYGDTALNKYAGILQTDGLNHMLSFNEETGILTCEAGVTLAEIIDVFLPRGYYLPVTPGTTYVTVGGAIANDVHGKNHHVDGCFSEFVEAFDLLLASGDVITSSRTENKDAFWATISGIGLTGIILTATMRLIRVNSSYIDVTYEKAKNLDEAFEKFIENDANFKYSVAWIDCLSSGDSLGRSVLMRGDHAQVDQLPKKVRNPYHMGSQLHAKMPMNAPSLALNRYSIAAFNELYYRSFKNERKIVHQHSFFHPLDAIDDWNKLYGKHGFIQYQAVLPSDQNPKEGMRQLLTQLSKEKRASFLAVLKSSGPANKGYLTFMKKGYTLALDIPIKDGSIFETVKKLDDIVLAHGGRVYLAKDSTLDEQTFKQMYPDWETFMETKYKLDPDNHFSSSMARRIGLV